MDGESAPSRKPHSEREHFFRAARLVAALTMGSRVLGLIRDMLLVPMGSGVLADRFWMAYSIPNLFRRLFGEGALSAAFVPVFSEVSEAEGWDRARMVLANVAGLLAIILVGIVILIELGLGAYWLAFGGDWAARFLLQMVAMMMPFMITVCLLALGSAALQCKGHFAYPAFAPIMLNVCLIIGARVFAPALADTTQGQFAVVVLSLLAAGVLQVVGVAWLLRRAGLLALPTIRPVLPEMRRILKFMLPMLIPMSILQLSTFADRAIALQFSGETGEPLLPGLVRCLYAAARLYMLPLGVLAVPVATAIFPLLGRYAARDDHAGLRDTTNRALRLCLFLGIPAAVALILLADDLVSLIFQRDGFTAADTARTAWILRMYCIGLWAYFCNQLLLRAFFAIKKPSYPLRLACILAAVNVVLVIAGIYTPLAGGAIGLATALTQSLTTLLLVRKLHTMWGVIGFRQILRSLVRVLIATGVMAAALWTIHLRAATPVENLLTRWGLAGATPVVMMGLFVLAGAATFLLAARALRCEELHELRKK